MGSATDAWGEVGVRWRLVGAVLAASAAGAVFHQLVFRRWWIEDAAISFAYARNLALGYGLVPWPGGERIEGYSNPTWVALLAACHAVGVEGFTASKLLGGLFAVLSLWPAWRLARIAVHPDDRPADLLAPVLLAASAQFAIWSASGLENALFGFLLLGGAARLATEAANPRFPWSAVWFLALSWTRPEGVIYAAVAWAWVLLAAARDRRGWGGPLRWIALFGLPEAALIGLRLSYFAWPLPNTYYAKLQDFDALFGWRDRGWLQLRAFAGLGADDGQTPGGPGLGQGFLIPVFLAGLFGLRGWRAWVWLAAVAAAGALLAMPGPDWLRNSGAWPSWHPPLAWLLFRIGLFYSALVMLPVAALGPEGFGLHRFGETRFFTRALLAHLFGAALVFSVYSTGDWMRGYRWLSLAAPTGAVLLAVGIGEWAGFAERVWARLGRGATRRGWGIAGAGLAVTAAVGFAAANVRHTMWFARDPEWPPALIKLRVDHTRRLAQRVFYEEPIVPLDMDMGAHLWFSHQHPVDMARLVDIPLARHRYDQRAFVEEYIFEEHRPDFVHWHGEWARTTLFSSYDGWSDYFPAPGYADPNEARGHHTGIYMRRSMLVDAAWAGTEGRAVAYPNGIRLHGWEVPSPEVAENGRVYLEIGLSMDVALERWSAVGFLAGPGGVRSWVLPPGQGLLPPGDWRPGEVFHGRWGLPVGGMPPGTYDFGLVFVDAAGAIAIPDEGAAADPRYAAGEVRWPGVVTVVADDQIGAFAEADLAEARQNAASLDCQGAEESWFLAKRHLPGDVAWATAHEPTSALATCWARAAEEQRGERRVASLARAHRWDPASPELARVGGPTGARLWETGLAARDREDWELAYASFRDLLSFQPWRSWARRYAEEARDHRLGLN